MRIGTLFVILVWEGKRYPVSQRHRNYKYFTLAPDLVVKVVGESDTYPPQLVVEEVEESSVPDGETLIRLRHL